jgi:hypothetical protein
MTPRALSRSLRLSPKRAQAAVPDRSLTRLGN